MPPSTASLFNPGGHISAALKEEFDGPFPASWWDESDGDVLWWCWDGDGWLSEAPYIGSPLDLGMTVECHTHRETGEKPAARFSVGGWPAYHTHWTRLPPQPPAPKYPTST